MSEMDPELFREYLAEVFESLDGLDEIFVSLEKNPTDTKIVDSIFRPVHSIKGSSAFFGLDHITSFAHKMENILDEIRKEKRQATPTVIDVCLKGTDFLKVMFDRISSGDMNFVLLEDEKNFIENIAGLLGDDEAESAPKTLGHHFGSISELVADLKTEGKADMAIISKLEAGVAALESIFNDPQHRFQVGEAGDGGDMPKVGKLGDILVEIGAVSREEVEATAKEKEPEKMLGAALVEKGAATEEMVEEAVKVQEKEKKEQSLAATNFNVQKTMRIDEEKVDEFMDQIGELVIISEVFNYLEKRLSSIEGAGYVTKEFKSANMNFSELTLRLQHGLSEVRKVAVKTIFQKIPRIVRDIASALGKEVDISTSGETVMLDKSLAEKLESPIIHMVRNSIDHGVEIPSIREAAGKDITGKVVVDANIVGEMLYIELYDDGGGLSRKKLLEKAVSRGIVNQAEANNLSNSEVFDLIFHPGFSTAEKVTDISGRGVGMDVVKRAITESKGKVEIESELGKFTRFTISLPVSTTLVTINGLVTAVGSGRFIFPVEDVKESLRPSGDEVFTVRDQDEMINIRGDIFPLIRLYNTFHQKTDIRDPKDGVCLIIEKNGKKSCVLTDAIVEQQNVVLKDLGDIFCNVHSIMGGAILGDGSIGLVVNVEGLLEGY